MRVSRYAWVGILLVVGIPAASAQDGEEDDRSTAASRGQAPERCIALNRVDRTEVIDDRTLIFHMRNRGMYLNHLDRECPGLKREERFMYSPTGNRLCNIDIVTVLENWGFGLTRGFTCTLGFFHPISDADLTELKRGAGEGDDGGDDAGGDIEVEPVDPDQLEQVLEDDEGHREGSADEE